MIALLVSSLPVVIWAYLLTGRGGFWRAAERDDAMNAPAGTLTSWPRVVVVVPARDEAEVIGESIASLLRQDYAGSMAVIVVDDHSSDDTATIARDAATAAGAADRLTVLAAPPLPSGWIGKLWAIEQGTGHSQSLLEPPEFFLLTDADIVYSTDALTRLVLRAQRDHLVLTSLMAKLRCESFAEHALMPAFIFFFALLYPFAWVNRATSMAAAAAGGCMLVRRDTLRAAGGVAAIRGEIIDDCALARLLKGHGPIWLCLTERAKSVRAYRSIGDVRRMISRSAYAQLRFSPWLLAVTVLAMVVTYLVPPWAALSAEGASRILGAATWAIMGLALQPTLRFYGVSPWWGLAFPAIAIAYLAFTLDSAYAHAKGRGGVWKGRVQSPASKR